MKTGHGYYVFMRKSQDGSKVTVKTAHDEMTVDDILELFESFLTASGYSLKGHLGIVEDTEL